LSVTSPDIAPAVPTRISELAANCARFVRATTGVDLDLTHETLPLLDHYMSTARAEITKRPEATPLVAQAAGAYFGQVLALEFGGFWRVEDSDEHRWLLWMQPVFLALNPIGVGYDVLMSSSKHAGPSSELRLARDERELVEQRLAALPEVSESEFYTFATRFDAVQVAVEALRSHMVDAGLEDVSFEFDDYLSEFGG
jgi:hypothetical protein